MIMNEHTYRLQNRRKVELLTYIYLLAIDMNKRVYFCKAFIFNATTDVKKDKFSLKYIVL